MSLNSGKSLLLLAGVGLLLQACASMTHDSRHQYVYVQSDPPGARVFDRKRELGTTPTLVYLRRQKSHELELELGKERKKIFLDSQYRWVDSGMINVVLGSLAPIGWIVDYASGAAWTMEDPPSLLFSKAVKTSVKTEPPVLALAPPLAESFSLSDEAAQYWEKRLSRLYPEAKILPYKSSLRVFQEAGYEYDARPEDPQRYRKLLYGLRAQQIFFSEARPEDASIHLKGERKDLTGKTLENPLTEKIQAETSFSKELWFDSHHQWIQIIPNTLGVEFSSTTTTLGYGLNAYVGYETTGGKDSNLRTALSYLQALTLTRLQTPRLDGVSRVKFQFTPSVRFSYKKIFFPDFEKLASVNFDYIQFGIGLGPEIGWQSGKHYLYMKYVPLWTYYQVDWIQPGGGPESRALGTLDSTAELGYLYFFNDRLSLKLFSKSATAEGTIWNSVSQKINPTTPQLTYSGESYVGLSVGYTFEVRSRMASP